MTANGTLPAVDAWHVETMRVTAFPGDVVSTEQLSWWEDTVGFPPETVQSRPRTGQYQARGDFEGRQLILQVQPGRIEWTLRPIMKAEDEPGLPLLGPFSEVVASLSKVVVPWLPKAPALNRFAFGAALLQPVESVRSGYALIQKYLPAVRVDPDGSSDLFYQINRRRPSVTRIDGLRMNRLSKWSVQLAEIVTMTVGSGNVVTRALGTEAACRLELDINTTPDFAGAFPPDQLRALLQEMIDLGHEIAQKGDIP